MRANVFCIWAMGIVLAVPTLAGAEGAQLADAAKRQDKVAIQTLLKQKVDVNAPQPDGATALHWAAHWNDLATADLLLKAKASVNARNDYGVTPLSLACENGSAPMVERLLKAGADANLAMETGETPLLTAIRAGSLPVVKLLLAGGADVNLKGGPREQSPLMWAVARWRPDIVRALIENGADITAQSRIRPEYVSFARGDPQGGRLRGQADGTFTSDGTRPGIRWIKKGGLTPFLFAAQLGERDSGEVLLNAGASVNDETPEGETALMMAAHNYHGEYAIWLLDHGADPNRTRTGFTALHLAAATKDLDLVKALLAHGAKVNVRLERGTPKSDEPAGKFSLLPEYMVGATPFLMASALNEIEIMKVLVAAGADPKINMVDGVTPLIAALGIDPGVLGLAPFRRGAPRDYFRAAPGDPPGSAPTRKKSGDEDPTLETVKYVIELGVDVNAARLNNVVYHGANPRTKFGRDAGDTALHTAAADKLPSVIEYLVSHGARMDLKNKRGLTPLGLAASDLRQYLNGYDGEKVGDPEIAALFRNLGAKE